MFAIHNGAARHCCLATALLRNQRNPCIEQSLRTRTMLKMSSCVQPAQLYASLPFGARPLFAMRNGAARHCCLTTAPLRNQRNPCIEQSLRAHTMLKMSSCVQTEQLYASTIFCAGPTFAMRNKAARHCCLATAPLRNQRNPCIEQSLRTCTMLRCRPACRPHSYMRQHLFAHVQCLQYTAEALSGLTVAPLRNQHNPCI